MKIYFHHTGGLKWLQFGFQILFSLFILGTYVLSNTGYVFKYWRADKNVTLSTGETIIVGSPIYNVTSIIVNDNIVLTPVFDVGTYSISYVGDENIRISGNTSEMVTYPNKLVGTTYEVIDSNYKDESKNVQKSSCP